MNKPRILIVEDDPDILELMRYNLEKAGYIAETAPDGPTGLSRAAASPPDLILLDLMLPGIDGLSCCRRLREEPATENVPVVMVTALSGEHDVVTGLDCGASDYICKPFSPRVLLARIRALLRRNGPDSPDALKPLACGPVALDPRLHSVTLLGERLDLTLTEFRLLQALAGHPGRVYTRDQLIDLVRGQHFAVTDRIIDVHLVALRRKLRPYGDLIETVRGVGYRFNPAATPSE